MFLPRGYKQDFWTLPPPLLMLSNLASSQQRQAALHATYQQFLSQRVITPILNDFGVWTWTCSQGKWKYLEYSGSVDVQLVSADPKVPHRICQVSELPAFVDIKNVYLSPSFHLINAICIFLCSQNITNLLPFPLACPWHPGSLPRSASFSVYPRCRIPVWLPVKGPVHPNPVSQY